MAKTSRKAASTQRWNALLGRFFLALGAHLPWSAQKFTARFLAAAIYYFFKRRRHVVEVNLNLCFPEWDAETREHKVRDVLFNNALGLLETANAYYYSQDRLREIVSVQGLELLTEAKAKNQGVLLLGAHYSHLDLGGALLSLYEPVSCIYRPHNNPFMDQYIADNRLKFLHGLYNRDDMRGIVKALKRNELVWYPPDQDYGPRHAVFAPFFGIPAATITATSRLVKMTGAEVLTIAYRRDKNRQFYQVDIEALDEPLTGSDDVRDAEIVNRNLERCIRRAPTQYMWTHRRFKTQPGGKGVLYQKSA